MLYCSVSLAETSIVLINEKLTMKQATIYHNPRCSKSRQALQLLKDRNVPVIIIDYLKHPPTDIELNKIIALLAIKPHDLLRQKEPLYRELHLADANDQQILQAIAANPILLERPIIIYDNKAVIARPAEKLADILP